MKITKSLGVATIVATAAALAGCSTGAGQPAPDDGTIGGELTITYDSAYQGMLDKVVAAFEAEHPDVSVNVDYQGGADIANLISTQLQSGTASDVILTYPGGDPASVSGLAVLPLAAQGRILDLSDSAWTKDVPDEWNEGTVGYEGKVYAYPGAVQPLAAIYNTDLLDELGVTAPTTLDEVLQLCATARDAGLYAYAQGLGEVSAGPQMLSFAQTSTLVYGPDPDFRQQLEDGSTTYQDSAWVDQFAIYQDMFDAGCFGDGALGRSRQQGAEAVAAGQALAQVDVGGQKAVMNELAPGVSFAVEGIPATDDGETFVTALPGNTLAVNAATKNPTTAKAFLDFVAEPEQSVLYANAFSAVPIIPNDAYQAPEDIQGFADLVASGSTARLAELGPNEVQVAMNEGIQSMLLGNDTPESVAEKMQAALEG